MKVKKNEKHKMNVKSSQVNKSYNESYRIL